MIVGSLRQLSSPLPIQVYRVALFAYFNFKDELLSRAKRREACVLMQNVDLGKAGRTE